MNELEQHSCLFLSKDKEEAKLGKKRAKYLQKLWDERETMTDAERKAIVSQMMSEGIKPPTFMPSSSTKRGKELSSKEMEKDELKETISMYKNLIDGTTDDLKKATPGTDKYARLTALVDVWENKVNKATERLKELDEDKVKHASEITLEHHGILGQKHGVRNGPPYPLSRAKHNKVVKSAGSDSLARDLSDDDLRKVIERLRLEAQYRELTKVPKKKKSAASKIIEESAQKAVKDVTSQTMKYVLGTAINQVSGRKIISLKEEKRNK